MNITFISLLELLVTYGPWLFFAFLLLVIVLLSLNTYYVTQDAEEKKQELLRLTEQLEQEIEQKETKHNNKEVRHTIDVMEWTIKNRPPKKQENDSIAREWSLWVALLVVALIGGIIWLISNQKDTAPENNNNNTDDKDKE